MQSQQKNPIHHIITITLVCGLAFLTSCSSLQSSSKENLDWGNISTISLHAPAEDPYNLLPLVHQGLANLELTLIALSDHPDLKIDFSTEIGRDLDSESQIRSRLKSLHMRFVDPLSENTLAAIDYFYPLAGDIDPAEGIREIFAAISQNARAETTGTPPERLEPSSQQSSRIKPSEQSTGPESQQTEQAIQQQSNPEQKNVNPSSPWLPRLKSWGFENWGKNETAN